MGPPRGPPPPMRGPPNGEFDGMRSKGGKPFMNGSDPHNGDLPTTSTQVGTHGVRMRLGFLFLTFSHFAA